MTESTDWDKFEALSPEEQARFFKEKPFKEKGDLILHAHDPRALTQSLSQEEFYLLTKEMDMEERSEIVRYANVPQLFFFTDVECWKGDRLDEKHFIDWLETLQHAGDEALMNWFYAIDYETVIAGLKKIITVVKPDREWTVDEVLGDTPYFTLDDFYYVAVSQERMETVRRCLEVLYENHRGRYHAFLEGVMAEIDDPVEEEAYVKRETRLADRGFPEKERALLIYKAITREEFEQFPKKKLSGSDGNGRSAAEGTRLPDYPVLWSKDRVFLDDVFAAIRNEKVELLEQIEEELVWLSNKVITVQGLDFSSEEKVRMGIERARSFVSLGLELLSGSDVAKAAGIVKERWLEVVFRWAVTRMLEMRTQAENLLRDCWPAQPDYFLMFLNVPYQTILRGLLRTVPQCHDDQVAGEDLPLRDFKTVRDLERTQISLDQLETVIRHLVKEYPKVFRAIDFEDESARFDAALFTVLGTLFASWVLKKRTRISPLSTEELKAFLDAAFESVADRRILRGELRERFLGGFYRADEVPVVRSLWNFVFDQLANDLGGLNPKKRIDCRYISSVKLRVKKDGEA
ncbi:MAG: DUF6178 family protein [Candidatus Omnitrophota bacterium]|jgi:hypothetical protein